MQAMESHVESVSLRDYEGKGTLDIEALTEYSGQGMCLKIEIEKRPFTRYQKQMKPWARSRNWRVRKDGKLDVYTPQSST